MTRIIIVCAFLAGCAPLSETACRGNNWYALGEQDALAGGQPRITQYVEQCARYQVQPAERDYMAGWGAGYSEWNNRVSRRGM
jgi:hypothetical protein